MAGEELEQGAVASARDRAEPLGGLGGGAEPGVEVGALDGGGQPRLGQVLVREPIGEVGRVGQPAGVREQADPAELDPVTHAQVIRDPLAEPVELLVRLVQVPEGGHADGVLAADEHPDRKRRVVVHQRPRLAERGEGASRLTGPHRAQAPLVAQEDGLGGLPAPHGLLVVALGERDRLAEPARQHERVHGAGGGGPAHGGPPQGQRRLAVERAGRLRGTAAEREVVRPQRHGRLGHQRVEPAIAGRGEGRNVERAPGASPGEDRERQVRHVEVLAGPRL